jgi:hypothetical protein
LPIFYRKTFRFTCFFSQKFNKYFATWPEDLERTTSAISASIAFLKFIQIDLNRLLASLIQFLFCNYDEPLFRSVFFFIITVIAVFKLLKLPRINNMISTNPFFIIF